ncbi:MAG: hypothetical protein HKO92_12170 [Flavobacteriaceae bacterium]|nr:hypothetical protein [Flavobacteriaceae bacterium]
MTTEKHIELRHVAKLDENKNPYLHLQVVELHYDGTETVHEDGDYYNEIIDHLKSLSLKDVVDDRCF